MDGAGVACRSKHHFTHQILHGRSWANRVAVERCLNILTLSSVMGTTMNAHTQVIYIQSRSSVKAADDWPVNRGNSQQTTVTWFSQTRTPGFHLPLSLSFTGLGPFTKTHFQCLQQTRRYIEMESESSTTQNLRLIITHHSPPRNHQTPKLPHDIEHPASSGITSHEFGLLVALSESLIEGQSRRLHQYHLTRLAKTTSSLRSSNALQDTGDQVSVTFEV